MKCQHVDEDLTPCQETEGISAYTIKLYSGGTFSQFLCKHHSAIFIGHAHGEWERARMEDAMKKMKPTEESEKTHSAKLIFFE
jgi:hypothetical protein